MKQSNSALNDEYKYESSEGVFSYYIGRDGGLCITAYEGKNECLHISEQINGYPVSTIGRKAFLGNRSLRQIILPDIIEEIGDWAFSRCTALQKITLPKREIRFGGRIFQKTDSLKEISFTGADKSLAELMALAATALDAEYLIHPLQAGCERWYRNLDARILAVLEEPEDSALKDLVYCAEEDMNEKQEAILKKQEHHKAQIAFFRLTHPEGMASTVRQYLSEYLCQRTKGCIDESAWEVIKKNRENCCLYCDKLFEIGGFHEENVGAALDDLGAYNIELKAYLLRKWQNRQRQSDFWGQLQLD